MVEYGDGGRKKVFGVKLMLWVILALTILALGYLGVGLFIADRLSAPSHHPQELTPTDVRLNYREVSIHSTDGLELAGWWVPGDDPSRAVVLVSGIEGDKSDRHIIKTASVYAGAGYGVLMIDLRAQGGSEGERVTMGYKEVRDVRGALLWLNERGFAPGEIVLHGFSLGGATVLRAAPKSGVAAVVEEFAYADLPLILRQQLPKVSGLPSFFTPGIFLMGKLFLGIDPWAVRPEEAARRLCEEGVRLLIIHSKDDEAVPFEHAERIRKACPEAAFWSIEGYRHVGAYAHPRYRERLLNFLRTLEANESSKELWKCHERSRWAYITEDRISTKSCQVPLLRCETLLVSFRRNCFPGERRKEMTSLEYMLGHPHYASQEALSSR